MEHKFCRNWKDHSFASLWLWIMLGMKLDGSSTAVALFASSVWSRLWMVDA